MNRSTTWLALTMMVLALSSAYAQNDAEIRIGQTMPYSGPLSGFAAIGRAEEAYFAMLNAKGGINNRKIKFITLDDGYSPPKTLEQTRKLVESDNVHLIFSSFGTVTNSATQKYLNGKGVPQLFILSGSPKWDDPKNFPWSMPVMTSSDSEGFIYAKYILQKKPDAKIAILAQNDDFGRDNLSGFKRALGDKAAKMIVAETNYESTAPTITSQIAIMKASGADVVFGATLGKFTTQLIKGLAEQNWKPDMFFLPTSAASITFFEPAGVENAVGILSSSFLKDVNEPQWAGDEDVKDYFKFMRDQMPGVDPRNVNYAGGYFFAMLAEHVLRACGDDISAKNIMAQASSLKGVRLPLMLPGITASTSASDYLPFQQLQLRRFDGKNWISFGEIMDDR
jgi:branched-chain amino acid transport system substrate-binding protein